MPIRELVPNQRSSHLDVTSEEHTASLDSVERPQAEPYHGKHADRVRRFVLDAYIIPGRANDQRTVRVRAGDVDKALGHHYKKLHLICAALKSKKFLDVARASIQDVEGPPSHASSTTVFTFELER